MTNDADRIAAAWTADRAYLLATATRVLSDAAEAEDVVQEAFARLAVAPVAEIADLRAWLLVVVRHLALDRLGSARHRLTTPADTAQLSAHAAAAADPADRVTLDDEVRGALGVVLDRLTPAQRTAFLLHDVFGVPFASIAELVGRSPGACRQLASEARQSIRRGTQREPAHPVDPALAAVTSRFAVACAGGDLDELIQLLDPRVSGWATIDGKRVGFAQGATVVAERLLLFVGPRRGWRLTPIPLEDGAGLLATRRAEPMALIHLDFSGYLIRGMHAVVLAGAGARNRSQ